jgi:hypothetical protein
MYGDNKMVQIHVLFNDPKKLFFVYIQNRKKYMITKLSKINY